MNTYKFNNGAIVVDIYDSNSLSGVMSINGVVVSSVGFSNYSSARQKAGALEHAIAICSELGQVSYLIGYIANNLDCPYDFEDRMTKLIEEVVIIEVIGRLSTAEKEYKDKGYIATQHYTTDVKGVISTHVDMYKGKQEITLAHRCQL